MLVQQKEIKKLQQSFKQTVVSRGEGRRRRRRRRDSGCEEVVLWELY
jgi:hypothetical protein